MAHPEGSDQDPVSEREVTEGDVRGPGVEIESIGNVAVNAIEIVRGIVIVNVIGIATGSDIIMKPIPERDHAAEIVSENVNANESIEKEAERKLQHIRLRGRE